MRLEYLKEAIDGLVGTHRRLLDKYERRFMEVQQLDALSEYYTGQLNDALKALHGIDYSPVVVRFTEITVHVGFYIGEGREARVMDVETLQRLLGDLLAYELVLGHRYASTPAMTLSEMDKLSGELTDRLDDIIQMDYRLSGIAKVYVLREEGQRTKVMVSTTVGDPILYRRGR